MQSHFYSDEVRVNTHHSSVRRAMRFAVAGVVLGVSLAACDKDPSGSAPQALTLTILPPALGDTILGRQEPIKVLFSSNVDQRSALDPENFIVTDRCTGLRVAGALRLAGDTLIFSPSSSLPFLTPLDIRIQNILDTQGRSLADPVIFSFTTEAPPVSDVSWTALNSPTNDFVNGVSFLTRQRGYLSTGGGAVYRTDNGGSTFAALFKDPDIILITGIRVAGTDTLYATAAPSLGGTTFSTAGLYRSINAGVSFTPVFLENPADMQGPAVSKPTTGRPKVVIGGNRNTLAGWTYDAATDSVFRFGPVANQIGHGSGIAFDGSNAGILGEDFSGVGVAYRSTNGGRTFVPVTTLPAAVRPLHSMGFRTTTDAIMVGDRSAVYRLNLTTGATTLIGAAQGIPQTDSSATTLQTYNFRRVVFAPGTDIGWMVGFIITRVTGQPAQLRGVILQTRDGGNSWTRQAVSNVSDNGLGFEALVDVSTIAPSFAATSGLNGFVAARTSDVQVVTAACSFRNTP